MTFSQLRIVLVDDYALVAAGLREMLRPYADQVIVEELQPGMVPHRPADIALYDTYGRPDRAMASAGDLLGATRAERLVIYSWEVDAPLVESARRCGMDAVLSKTVGGAELVSSLLLIASGRRIFPAPAARVDASADGGVTARERATLDVGLTTREAEMITLIAQGFSNAQIAEHTFLSPNSVKSYIRSAYRKIHVQRRSQAVAWGIDHLMVSGRVDQVD